MKSAAVHTHRLDHKPDVPFERASRAAHIIDRTSAPAKTRSMSGACSRFRGKSGVKLRM
ncbi:hypothetical protein K9U40_03865 [Xanthobacter autotrophicus]|uniref:hypothetical protein n=1 Tax=Xanthobacter TaxID=279 RepID=UPI0024AADACE|nr:hypothetical protein [Xanthobacter autotrophicus]MDI4663475.1 hypothetical protein [Xanthobacter autotrophicus]